MLRECLRRMLRECPKDECASTNAVGECPLTNVFDECGMVGLLDVKFEIALDWWSK